MAKLATSGIMVRIRKILINSRWSNFREIDQMYIIFGVFVFVQAEVYKSDFDEERAARVKMAELKESLMEEIQQLQMSNQHLLDEQESLARNQLAEMQRRHAHPAYHPGFQTFPRQHPAPAGAYAPVPEVQGARYNQPAIRVAADRDVFVENAEERLVGEEQQVYPGLTPRGIHGNQPAVEALPGRVCTLKLVFGCKFLLMG